MSKQSKEREKEVKQKKLNIAKGVFLLSAVLLVASIIIGIVTNSNRYDTSKLQGKAVTVEGTVRGVREQQDVEEQTNAVVTMTRYHLEIGTMYKGEERIAITDEAYSSREYAEKFIGETREVTVDDVTFVGLAEKPVRYTFLIGIFAGLVGILGSLLYTYKLNGRTTIESKEKFIKVKKESVVSKLTPKKVEEEV